MRKNACEFGHVHDGQFGLKTVELYKNARAGKATSVDVATGALAPLVNPAKSRSGIFEQINSENGEILSFEPDFKNEKIVLE